MLQIRRARGRKLLRVSDWARFETGGYRNRAGNEKEGSVTKGNAEILAEAIRGVFVSPNESDRNFEDANVVDGLFAIARALDRIAVAVKSKEGK